MRPDLLDVPLGILLASSFPFSPLPSHEVGILIPAASYVMNPCAGDQTQTSSLMRRHKLVPCAPTCAHMCVRKLAAYQNLHAHPVEAHARMDPRRCLRKPKACPPKHKLLQISLFFHTVIFGPRMYSSLTCEVIGSIDILSSCSRLSHNARCHCHISSHEIPLSTFQQNLTTTPPFFFI